VTVPLTEQQMDVLLAQWNDWLSQRTDAMLSLEDRVRTAGSAADEADLAAAFVARKAVADRLQQIDALAEHHRDQASALANEPLTDNLGGPVGANLADAAVLIDAIVQRVEQRVGQVEHQAASDVAVATAADGDLQVAERLAVELGDHVNRAAQLRGALSARRDLAAVARDSKALRLELEEADGERRQLFERWRGLTDRLRSLAESERTVRQTAERCRVKIAHPPVLAVPSVAAIGELETADELTAKPWSAARAVMAPVVSKVDRLEAALTEAQRRFQRPLEERDELRGLLQAFRDKAASHGLGEDAALEPLYRQAESVLWAAPCDLGAARDLVTAFVSAVNARTGSAAVSGKVES
jgi:hypothetical protein